MKRTRLLLIFVSLLLFSDSLYSQLWKEYADSAKFYTDQKKDDKAFEFYNKETAQLKKDSAGTDSYAKMAIYLANLYTQKKQFDKSESLFLDAKKVNETLHGKESPAYTESCNELAKLYFLVHKYDKDIEIFSEIRSNNKGAKNIDYVKSSINLATIYIIKNETEKAEVLYIEALQLIEKIAGKTHPYYTAIEDRLGDIYEVKGSYEKAEPLYLEERQIREKNPGKETDEYASSCNSLAVLYTDMGEYDKAMKLCIEAKNLREKILSKDNPEYVGSLVNLARLYDYKGNYEKAETLYLEAKKILEKDTASGSSFYAKSFYAKTCSNLAILYVEMGLYEKALPLELKAKQIDEINSGKESEDYVRSCNNIASVYLSMGLYEKAEPYYLEAKQIQEKLFTKDNIFYASTCIGLAILYQSMKQYKKAESFYLEAKQLREKNLGKNHSDYANTVNALAMLYYQTGQYKKAEKLYLEAKQIREKILGKEHPSYTESCLSLANVYSAEKEFENADKLYTETFELQNIQLKKVFEFSSEIEKQSYIHTMPDFENYFFSFLTSSFKKNPELSYNIALFRRNLILSSLEQLRQAIYQTNDTILRNKYDAWMGGREIIAFWNSKPVSQRPSYLQHLEDSTENLEKDIARMSSAFKNQNNERQIKWKNIQQQLKPGEASIEFLDFQYNNINKLTDSTFYIALLLRKDKPEPQLIKLFEKKQLDSILDKKGNDENENITNLYTYSKNNSSDKSIYNLIWKPMEKSLKGIRKIYFAPSGDLYRIAFAALPVGKNKVLSDKYQLVELNTTASVTDQSPSFINTDDTIQLYGGIQYDADSTALKQVVNLYDSNKDNIATRSIPDDLDRGSKFNYLPGTETEIENIKKQSAASNYHVRILSGINATEESFKALNGNASTAVIHIATHGFFFPDPKEEKDKSLAKLESGRVFRQSDNPLFRSGLAFAGANYAWSGKPIDGIDDGILTAYDVSNMYLPNTKLVVLSACETALGEIEGSEGVYGLQRAFKIAGVKNLMMSLWKVPDQATAEFMKAFYKNIFAKQSISDAFYHAQTTMKNKYRDEPYNWAAWILVR